MKRWKLLSDGGRAERNRIAFQGGSYSLIATAVVLAILIALNILVSALPANLTKYDISASKLYSITSNTKVVVNALEEDVTIYWIVQSGEEDDVIETLLNKYDSLSDHITVVKKNPDVYPTFAEQYTSETVQNNSLVVECGERSRFIGYDDIYVQEPDIYSYSYNTSFDGEGAITSAIDYVVTEDLPQLYVVEGHGEQALPDNFQEQIEQEVEMLSSYAEAGGKLLVMAGPTEEGSLSNLYSLLSDYGVSTTEGIVVEGDREHYTGYPYVLLPEMSSHAITDPLMEEHYYPNMPISQGMTVDETAGSAVTVLLSTSEEAFSKSAGYQLTSYEKEEGDVDGPFAVGLSID